MTEVTRGAILSEDRLYRYELTRRWNPHLPSQIWVMLNPSTADAYSDDPTIRRCMKFAQRQGYGGIVVLNLFAFRSSSPLDLMRYEGDREGPKNRDAWEGAMARWALWVPGARMVAAWGANAADSRLPTSKAYQAWRGFIQWECLGTTQEGHPRHPLYVRANEPFRSWRPPRGPETTISGGKT